MTRVLILRCREDAERTAREVAARGHQPLILPTEEIVPLGSAPPVRNVAGFIVTSANAVAPLAAAFPADPRPLLAVGETTAARAREAGFAAIETGRGRAADLVEQARELAQAVGGPLLYAAGRVRRPDLETGLAERGTPVHVWEVYDTRPLRPDPAETAQALGGGPPDAVLLLSAGQAEAYAWLAGEAASLFRPPPRLLCLSARIRDALPQPMHAQALVSRVPRLFSLFDCFL
ncbi:uroporphyrinogen-III synthase [Consotaella aegiceratis]|uniref:uroporphyrinogen-III synthase n=1 Tax=Consotaella aegiceratis TaxID=3097961 RepID=UPI002F4061A2